MITKKRSSREVLRYSPYQHQRKCIKTGMENMHSDVRLKLPIRLFDIVRPQSVVAPLEW